VQCKRGFGDMNCFLIVALLTIVPCEIRADAAQPSLSAAIQWDSAALQGVRDAIWGRLLWRERWPSSTPHVRRTPTLPPNSKNDMK
jgi:hypothetical protein